MKMRKALSFVLVLALVLGSFSMVFAADGVKQGSDLSDISGNANYDAIVANSDLGIITGYEDGSYKPANAVNRAEFAAMITRMMGVPDSALAGYSSTNFTDMTGYGWAGSYVGFCAAKGIVNGYGDGTFGPGNTITVNEAVTMVLRAVGYVSNSSELVGTWPSNYVTLGKRLGIYDDVASTTTIDRANAAQVIYNALTTVVVAVNADGDTKAAYTTGSGDNYYEKNVLEVYLDCALYGDADDLDKDGFGVYPYEAAQDSVVNTMGYVGAYVKAFANDDGDVVAIAESKSTFLSGKYDAGDEEFKAGGEKYTLTAKNLEKARAALLNMKNVTPLKDKEANIKAASVDKDNGTLFSGTVTLAVDMSGKTIKEVYSVSKWNAQEAVFFEKDMLEDDNLDGFDFALDNDKKIDNGQFRLNGVKALSDIAVDNIVEVFAYGADKDKDIIRVDVGTKTVEGTITSVDGSDFTIDDTVYGLADPFADDKDSLAADDDEVVGNTGTAYLNFTGDIAGWDEDSASADNYAIVSGDYIPSGGTVRNATIMLVDKTGTEKEYVVKGGTDLDYDKNNDGKFNESGVDILAAGDLVEGTIVTFGLDKNGKIDELTYVLGADESATANTATAEVNKNRTIYDNKKLDSGVVIFTYDGAGYNTSWTYGGFDVIALSDLEAEKAFKEGAKYYVDTKSGKIKVMLVPDKYTGADTVYAVINSVLKSTKDGDTVLKVKGFADGKEVTWYTDDETCGDLNKGYDVKTATDYQKVFALTLNAAGVITDAEALVDVGLGLDGRMATVTGEVTDKGTSTLQVANNWLTLNDNVQYYTYDKGDQEFNTNKDINKKKGSDAGSQVWVWQVDEDSDAYDFVVIYKAASTNNPSTTVEVGTVSHINSDYTRMTVDGDLLKITEDTILYDSSDNILQIGAADMSTNSSVALGDSLRDIEIEDGVVVSMVLNSDEVADAAIAALTNSSITITDAAAQPEVTLNVPATVNGVTFTFTSKTDDNATVAIAGDALTATVTRNAVTGTPTITVTATKGAATATAVYVITVPAGATATDAVTIALQ